MKLLVISHTEHYIDATGQIVGWEPTVRELDELSLIFDEITHVACLYDDPAPNSAAPYRSGKVKFVAIPPYGGPGLMNKLSILSTAPKILSAVLKALKQTDVFQFRAPTSMGIYIIPALIFCTRKIGWFKYAGNWIQDPLPISYAIQRWCLLYLQNRPVTINGHWRGQKSNFLSFENPCLTSEELISAKDIARNKSFDGKLTLCFAGALKPFKGVRELLEAFKNTPEATEFIEKIILAGDGPLRAELEQLATQLTVPVVFKGYLRRQQLEEVYAQSHVVCLPSQSEGFPKVIAEGAAYGCIPLVTDVSSLGQYIQHGANGFLLPDNTAQSIARGLKDLLNNQSVLCNISVCAQDMATLFTYERYRNRIIKEIISPG